MNIDRRHLPVHLDFDQPMHIGAIDGDEIRVVLAGTSPEDRQVSDLEPYPQEDRFFVINDVNYVALS